VPWYTLRKDHPEFARVRGVLEQSAKNQSPLWLSIDMDGMLVKDALPAEREGKKLDGKKPDGKK
jgi:hypothetical protein